MDDPTFHQEASSLFLPLSAIVLFSVFYVLALLHRNTVLLHARFMVLTGLPMIDPVLGRVLFHYGPPLPHPLLYQAITFGLTDLVAIVLIYRPSLPASLRATYVLPAALLPTLHVLWFTLAQRQYWLPVATWFRGLPLT